MRRQEITHVPIISLRKMEKSRWRPLTQVGKKFLAEKKFSQALREMVRRNPSLKGIELKHVNDGVR